MSNNLPYLNAGQMGVNPTPYVQQATAQGQQGMSNMYHDLGVGTQGGPGSPMTQDLAAIGNQGNALNTQLSIQNQGLQTSELGQAIQAALSGQQSGSGGLGTLFGLK
jgi:hypothetical protein